MTPRDKVLDALKGERKDLVPVSAVTQVGTVEAMEKAGAHWPAAHSDAEQMVELGISLYKLAGLETARIPFCLTVQAEALGCKINMGNISAAKVLLTGTPEQVKQECRKAINAGIDVLAPGCGIAPRTKLENIRALVSAVV